MHNYMETRYHSKFFMNRLMEFQIAIGSKLYISLRDRLYLKKSALVSLKAAL